MEHKFLSSFSSLKDKATYPGQALDYMFSFEVVKFLLCRFILDKKIGVGQPKRIENAKILVANTAMDTDKVKIYGARVRVDSMTKVADLEAAEKGKMREKVQKIISHGINCFVNRQLIYNFPEELFADAGILAIEHADFDGIERLGLVTGGEIASTFDNPESVKLGHCKLIEEIMIGEDKLIHFSGVEMGQACTIVLRGARYVGVMLFVFYCNFSSASFVGMEGWGAGSLLLSAWWYNFVEIQNDRLSLVLYQLVMFH